MKSMLAAMRILMTLFLAASILAGCGGSSGSRGSPNGSASFSVGGSVVGLTTGNSFVIQNNGGDSKTISANGPFTFDTSLNNGAAYAVAISTQPAGQTCYVTSGGNGNVAGANVSGINVVCSSASTASCDINITTSDSYTKLEAATPGQTVCIAPGTYSFRVWLHKQASAAQPITIRALDPAHRPVFDYTGWTNNWVSGVPPFPGSYGSGDAYRSAWRVDGAYYTIDGIIIQNANNAGNNNFDNTAGIRYVNSSFLTIRNCRLYRNDMGIQGGGSNTLIEYTEFDRNGYAGSDQSHNLYVLGGDVFTLRYSYSHDSIGGQNFHIRARNAVVAYNWFENAADYEGDMMTNTTQYDGGANGVQSMLFIGNVVIQNPVQGPGFNGSKLLAVFNDQAGMTPTMNLTALWNTFYFNDSGSVGSGVVQFGGNSSTVLAGGTVIFSNNVVGGTAAPSRNAILTGSGTGTLALSGTNNFFLTGMSVSTLANSTFDTDAKFVNPSQHDYRLQPTSPAYNLADTSVNPQPVSQFSTPAPVGNPLGTPPAADPPSVSGDVSSRASVSNPGAVQN